MDLPPESVIPTSAIPDVSHKLPTTYELKEADLTDRRKANAVFAVLGRSAKGNTTDSVQLAIRTCGHC